MKLSASTAHIQRSLPLLGLIAAALRLQFRRAAQARLFAEPEIVGRNEAMKRILAKGKEER